jgi:hypothetical protein
MKKKQQHPGGGADPWPHGAPLGGAPPGLGGWKRRVSLLPFLRFSLRDYGFCMATLLVFCLGSLFYQLSGGPPRFLLDLRQYLGKDGWQARGRRPLREVVPGDSWCGHRPPVPRGSPGVTPASIHPSGRRERLPASAPGCAQPRRWRWVARPGRYPGAGHRIPTCPRPATPAGAEWMYVCLGVV